MTTPTNREELIRLRAKALFLAASGDHEADIADLSTHARIFYESQARAALKAEEAAGVVCVPKEPSDEMLAKLKYYADGHSSTLRCYADMLAASPFAKGPV